MNEQQAGERFLRQLDFANPLKFKHHVSILGVGAVGSVVALGVTKVGNPKGTTMVDCDTFEEHNVANQLSAMEHLGRPKAYAIAEICQKFGALGNTVGVHARLVGKDISMIGSQEQGIFPARSIFKGIVVSTPDNMQARKDLWSVCKYNPDTPFLLDARVAGQYVRLLAVDTMTSPAQKFYESTLVDDKDTTPESCSGRGVIDCSLIAGGILTTWVRKLQVGEMIPLEVCLDISKWEVTVRLTNGSKVSNREALALAEVGGFA